MWESLNPFRTFLQCRTFITSIVRIIKHSLLIEQRMTIILTTCALIGSGLRCGHIYLPIQHADKDEKRNVMYSTGGWTGVTCLHLACRLVAPDDIVKALLDIRGKQLVIQHYTMHVVILMDPIMSQRCWLTSAGRMSSCRHGKE